MLVYKINIYKINVDIDTEVHVQYILEGEKYSRNRDSYSGKKIVFCSIVFDEYDCSCD